MSFLLQQLGILNHFAVNKLKWIHHSVCYYGVRNQNDNANSVEFSDISHSTLQRSWMKASYADFTANPQHVLICMSISFQTRVQANNLKKKCFLKYLK